MFSNSLSVQATTAAQWKCLHPCTTKNLCTKCSWTSALHVVEGLATFCDFAMRSAEDNDEQDHEDCGRLQGAKKRSEAIDRIRVKNLPTAEQQNEAAQRALEDSFVVHTPCFSKHKETFDLQLVRRALNSMAYGVSATGNLPWPTRRMESHGNVWESGRRLQVECHRDEPQDREVARSVGTPHAWECQECLQNYG